MVLMACPGLGSQLCIVLIEMMRVMQYQLCELAMSSFLLISEPPRLTLPILGHISTTITRFKYTHTHTHTWMRWDFINYIGVRNAAAGLVEI